MKFQEKENQRYKFNISLFKRALSKILLAASSVQNVSKALLHTEYENISVLLSLIQII